MKEVIANLRGVSATVLCASWARSEGKESVGPELPFTVGAERRSPADPTISGLTEEPEPELSNSNLAIARTEPLVFHIMAS